MSSLEAAWTETLMTNPHDVAAWVGRAQVRRQQGHLRGALEDYNEAIRLRGSVPELWAARAEVLLSAGQVESARSDADRALRLDGANIVALGVRAECGLRSRNPRRAIADFTEILRLEPETTRAYRLRAEAWAMVDQVGRALDDLSTAIRLDPKDLELRMQRAYGRIRAGQLVQAHEDVAATKLLLTEAEHSTANTVAWLLSTCSIAEFRDGPEAVRLAARAGEAVQWSLVQYRDTLACAYAECGDFHLGLMELEQVLAQPQLSPEFRNEVLQRKALFERGDAFRE
ncbi:MAG: tetratricopeptide repeat protein [Gemmataceae bacterium]